MDEFTRKVNRAKWLKIQAASLIEEADEILDSLGDLPVGQYPAGKWILQLTPTVRFDAATASRNLTKKQFDSILKPTPNAALAKALLGDDYKKTQKTYGVTRKIISVDDEEG